MSVALLVLMLAQQPRLISGHVDPVAGGGSLAQQVRGSQGPAWVGYTVDVVPVQRGCFGADGSDFTETAFLEGERTANILFRIDKGEVEKMRVVSSSCQLDIAGLTLHWLTGVRGADSVVFLRSLPMRNAIPAIGAHADASAETFLRETAESTKAVRSDRERAAHSLAANRGPAGLAVVLRLLEMDGDEKFRESLPGAIAAAPSNAGTLPLIGIATKDKNRKARERAFFWLGRSKDGRAQKFVEQILAK